jgi:hypothetical protein
MSLVFCKSLYEQHSIVTCFLQVTTHVIVGLGARAALQFGRGKHLAVRLQNRRTGRQKTVSRLAAGAPTLFPNRLA